MKGETVEEIVGFAEAIRAAAEPLPLHRESTLSVSGTGRETLVDTCGTGGDAQRHLQYLNCHRLRRRWSGCARGQARQSRPDSKCGSADVMEALGVKINLPAAVLATCLEEVGIVFLFAPAMHSAMKYVQPARRELRLRTIFNLLGPLTNPARASAQVVGVYSLDLVEKVAEALSMLGSIALLWSMGWMAWTKSRLRDRRASPKFAREMSAPMKSHRKNSESSGLLSKRYLGGDAVVNAAIIREILGGKRNRLAGT